LSWPGVAVKLQIMRKVKPKKRGRPATGKDPFIGIRLPPEMIARIANWAKRQKVDSRSAAIRALIELGFKNGRRQHHDPRRPPRGVPLDSTPAAPVLYSSHATSPHQGHSRQARQAHEAPLACRSAARQRRDSWHGRGAKRSGGQSCRSGPVRARRHSRSRIIVQELG
jgi:Arc/MetJ-type ribon-helix-helix transcriptional regulator